jgi:hypothetical protein
MGGLIKSYYGWPDKSSIMGGLISQRHSVAPKTLVPKEINYPIDLYAAA